MFFFAFKEIFCQADHTQNADFSWEAHKNQLEMQIVILIQSKVYGERKQRIPIEWQTIGKWKCAPGVNLVELLRY